MRRQSISLCIGLFLFALLLFAQSSANIVGTVRDASGAVVPGARVAAVNLQTGYKELRQTESDGSFKLLLLPVGHYQFSVRKKKGFQKYVQTDVALRRQRQHHHRCFPLLSPSTTTPPSMFP